MVILEIYLDNDKFNYLPGEVVSGFVRIDSNKPIKARSVSLQCVGKSEVEWLESRRSGSRSGSSTDNYYSKWTIMDQRIIFWEQEHESEKFPGGEECLSFSFQLPQCLPPTFKANFGDVTYKLKAKIDIPFWFDKEAELDFNVLPYYNLNYLPHASQAVQKDKVKEYGFCKKDKIDIQAYLNKNAYASGEPILCAISVQGSPDRYVKSITVSLLKTIECKAEDHMKATTDIIAKNNMYVKEFNQQSCYKISVHVPPTIPSFNTENIFVNYAVKVKVQLNGKVWDNYPEIFVPIRIGTVSSY
ncbi:CBN-ARRD-24 protein [Aphelenchoides bicaudatus]|nr:CBN-ARRD-24 protein [Aphelenchoides bicaudatus]